MKNQMDQGLAQIENEIKLSISQNDLIHKKYVELMKNSPLES